jgi:hypothetical protein
MTPLQKKTRKKPSNKPLKTLKLKKSKKNLENPVQNLPDFAR